MYGIKLAKPAVNLINAIVENRLDLLDNLVEAAQVYYRQDIQNLTWSFALLRGFEGISVDIDAYVTTCNDLAFALSKLAEDRESRQEQVDPFEILAVRYQFLSDSLQDRLEQIPEDLPHPLFQELFIVGQNVLKHLEPQVGALAARMPGALNFIERLEYMGDKFRQRYPEETELLANFDQGVEQFKQSLGGMTIFLEDNTKDKELATALALLGDCSFRIAASIQLMQEQEYENRSFSDQPGLEKIYRAIKEEDREQLEYAIADFGMTLEQIGPSVDNLLFYSLVPETVYSEKIEPFGIAWNEVLQAYTQLNPQDQSYAQLEQGLKELASAYAIFLQQREYVIEATAQYETSFEHQRWSEFEGIMRQVYAGVTPRYVLQEIQEQYWDELDRYYNTLENLYSEQDPEVTQALGLFEEGFTKVTAFLENHEKKELREAYELLWEAYPRLIASTVDFEGESVHPALASFSMVEGEKVYAPAPIIELQLAVEGFVEDELTFDQLIEVGAALTVHTSGLYQELKSVESSLGGLSIPNEVQAAYKNLEKITTWLGQLDDYAQSGSVLKAQLPILSSAGLELAKAMRSLELKSEATSNSF